MGRWRFCLAGTGELLDGGDLIVDHGKLSFEPIDFAPLAGNYAAQFLNRLVLMGQALFESCEPGVVSVGHVLVLSSRCLKPRRRWA